MSLPPHLAAVSRRFWDWLISPSLLFATVVLSFPAFLFQKNLAVLSSEAAIFFLLALARRGRLRLLPSILMIAGITFFSLFSPHGQVLLRLGGLAITEGAIETGLTRGITLAGMVFLSQLTLNPQVRLPGRIGAFVVDVFSVLEGLAGSPLGIEVQDKKKGWQGLAQTARSLISALDNRLYQAYWPQLQAGAERKMPDDGNHPAVCKGSLWRGVAAMVLWLLALYGLLVAS